MKKTFTAILLLLFFMAFLPLSTRAVYDAPDESYQGYVWVESMELGYEAWTGFLYPNYVGGFYFTTLVNNSTWDVVNDHLYMGTSWLGYDANNVDQGGDWAFVDVNTFEMEYIAFSEIEYTTPKIATGGYDTFMKTRGMYTDLTVDMRTFSDYNDNFIIQVYIIKNETDNEYTDLYYAQSIDYDINMQYSAEEVIGGVANTYISDEASGYKEKDDWAGYDSTYQVGYMYDFDNGISSPLYFGAKCLTDDLASFNIIEVVPQYYSTSYLGGSYAGYEKGVYDMDPFYGGGWPLIMCSNPMGLAAYECYDYMSNNEFDSETLRPDDYEIVASVGPFNLLPGEYKVIAFAIGGNVNSKADLINQMLNAQIYYSTKVDSELANMIPAPAPTETEDPYEIYVPGGGQTEIIFPWGLNSDITGDYADNSGYNVWMTIDWGWYVGIYYGAPYHTELNSFYSDTLYQPNATSFDGYSLVEGTDYTAGDSVQLWVSAIGTEWFASGFTNQSKTLVLDIDTFPETPTLSVSQVTGSGSDDVLLTWSDPNTKDQDIKEYLIYRSPPGTYTPNVNIATILTSTRVEDIYGGAGLDGNTLPLLMLDDGSTYRTDAYTFSNTHVEITGLDTGTTYVFKVSVVDFTDLVATSDDATMVMGPGEALNLTATMGKQTVKLNWTLSSDPNVFKYNVYRAGALPGGWQPDVSSGAWELIGATLASDSHPTRYVDKTIQDHQTYYYYVCAYSKIQNDESFRSNIANVTTSLRSAQNLDGVMTVPNPYKKGISSVNYIAFTRLTPEAEINIYTVSGSLIKTLTHTPSDVDPLGAGVQRWDLTNEDGEEVASGLYIWVVTNPAGDKKSGRLVIIR